MARRSASVWGLLFVCAGLVFAILPFTLGWIIGLSTMAVDAVGLGGGTRVMGGPDVNSPFVASFWVFLLFGVPSLVSVGFGLRVSADSSFSFDPRVVRAASTVSVILSLMAAVAVFFALGTAYPPHPTAVRLLLALLTAPAAFVLTWPVAYASNA